MVYTNMRDKQHPIKQIRMSEETWKSFKEKKIKSGKTWNLFIKKLLDELQ